MGSRPARKADPRRDRLAARLRDLRLQSALSQETLAELAGWVQPKISRIEKAHQLPSEDDLRAWAQHTGMPDELDALLGLLDAARVRYTATAELIATGALAARQTYIGALETAATRIGEYQPGFIPGLLQTADYARAVLNIAGRFRVQPATEETVEAVVAERIKRQAVLYDHGKQLQFVLGEAALWSAPGGQEVQAGQLDRLVAVAGLATVELSVMAMSAPMAVLPLSGFRLLDEEFVFVETIGGEQRLDDPHEVAVIVSAFDALRTAAVSGKAAIALIRRATRG